MPSPFRAALAALFAGLTLALASGAAAQAGDWRKAETPHFVVYSEEGEAPLRAYAQMLEDYDALLRAFHGRPVGEATAHKLSVYLVKDEAEFRRVCPEVQGGIVGNYLTMEEDVFVVAIRDAMSKAGADRSSGDATVLHEYTHHFMLQNYPDAYPAWWVEGYAEYFMTVDLGPGDIHLGGANSYRAEQIQHGKWLPVATLLTQDPRELPETELAGYYAEAWLLTHYIMDDPARRAAMSGYLASIKDGQDPLKAWRAAFRQTPQALDAVLRGYLPKAGGGPTWKRTWAPAQVAVNTLPEGTGAVLLENQLLKREVAPVRALEALYLVRANAKNHPDDHFAQIAAARGEVKFGDRDAGEAELQALIAKDPSDAEALRLLAVSKIARGARDEQIRPAVYREAGDLLSQAQTIDPENYQALYRLAQTRSIEPDYPNATTLEVLLKAVALSPQIFGARIEAGKAAMMRDQPALAREVLGPVAGDPHGGRNAAAARQILNRLKPLTQASSGAASHSLLRENPGTN